MGYQYCSVKGPIPLKGESMKIAIITDDGKTISQHFGRANYYVVLTVESGEIVEREMREKLGHKHFGQDHDHDHDPNHRHGFDAASQTRHVQMAQSIADCDALICRGMGVGAYESIKERGIRPVVTDFEMIEEAAVAYANGILIDHVEKLH
jgi:predicted Fe-Mo cluster-binding NifX family protein